MSGGIGRRCEIYEKIDALDEARTVADLAKRLQGILAELAYYAVTGEGAVVETHEEWRSQYADALYDAAASDANNDRVAATAADALYSAAPRAPAPSRIAKTARAAKPGTGHGERPRTPAPPSGRLQAAPPTANRSRPGDIPASLRTIMDGSHPSFKENE